MRIYEKIKMLLDENLKMPDYQRREILESEMKILREEFEGYKQEVNLENPEFVKCFNEAIIRVIRQDNQI